MKLNQYVLLAFTGIALLTGCGTTDANQSASGTDHSEHQHQLANGDLQETTAGLDKLPSFLDKVDPRIKQAYQVVAATNTPLQNIPCYCGCGKSAGHQSNAQCFIKEVQADGQVVWDDHGTRCSTCINIAVTTAKHLQDGKSLKDIRTMIDEQYKEGYAKPTPTPLPQ